MTSRWGMAVPLVGVAAGLIFAVSATVSEGEDIRPAQADRSEALAELDRTVGAKQDEVGALRTEVEQIAVERGVSDRDDPVARQAGLTEVRGEGIEVRLDDSPLRGSRVPEGFGPNDLVIHQEQVQAVVNALWAGGAEGIQLMDQRIVSTSAVRCVGNTLILQGRVYSPPFVIRAVGPVEDMEAMLDGSVEVQMMREYTDLVGLGYEQTPQETVELPPYSGTILLEEAVAEKSRPGARTGSSGSDRAG